MTNKLPPENEQDILDEFGLKNDSELPTDQNPSVDPPYSSSIFAPSNIGNSIQWKTIQPGTTITLSINFQQSSTFYGTVFGKTIK